MKLPSLLKNTTDHVIRRSTTTTTSTTSSWTWPSCHQPRTLSFRTQNDDVMFKTINSAYIETPDQSFFTESPESLSFSTASENGDPIDETVIRGLRSDRLFFEPDQTSSILEAKSGTRTRTRTLPFKDTVVISMDSKDPYVDFRKSMEEMMEAYGVKNWEGLEELLCWYLTVNAKNNHGFIVGAFVDLLVGFEFSSTNSSSSSYSSSHSPPSPLSLNGSSSMSLSSSCSTRCVSCLEEAEEEEVDTIPSPSSSSLLLEQVKKEITHEDKASSSSSS